MLSVEILGSAYEQFLGKQIRLTPSHKAVIEEKPEVRKAGGVYYTPEYIVEYIVKNTVGKLAPLNPPEDGGTLNAGVLHASSIVFSVAYRLLSPLPSSGKAGRGPC